MIVPDLEMRAAEALQNYLAADPFVLAQGLGVFRFDKAPSDPSGPMVIVTPQDGDEIAPKSGVYRITLDVQVLSAFGEPDVDNWHTVRTYGVRTALGSDALRAALTRGAVTGGLRVYDTNVASFGSSGNDKYLLGTTTLVVVASAVADEDRVDVGNFGSPPPSTGAVEAPPNDANNDAPVVGISACLSALPDEWYFDEFNAPMGGAIEIRANFPNALNATCAWSRGGAPLPWGNGSVIRIASPTLADSGAISCVLTFDKKRFQLEPLTLAVHPPGVAIQNAPFVASPKPRGAAPTASTLEFVESDGLLAVGMGDLRGSYPLCRFVSASGVTYIWGSVYLGDGFLSDGARVLTLNAEAKSSLTSSPSYAWTRAGAASAGAAGASYAATEAGIYTVTVRDGKNTRTSSITVTA